MCHMLYKAQPIQPHFDRARAVWKIRKLKILRVIEIISMSYCFLRKNLKCFQDFNFLYSKAEN